ncbi:MAG: Ppx/GppA phosphatase family protein [Thermodesulfobacteriota bacterium]|nr:Ppx/GppA phosphatase family protein [Thermodesulfobacteriota bacterium]
MEATLNHDVVAGIDLGSNSFRLLIATRRRGKLVILAKELATVRLGRGMGETRILAAGAIQRGLDVVRQYRATMDRFVPGAVRACGTQALRAATNSAEFLLPASEILGVDIEVISGEQEARLSLAGVLSSFSTRVGSFLVADVGGGSTEIIFSGEDQLQVNSLPVGAVSLTEFLLSRDTSGPGDLREARRLIREILLPVLPQGGQIPHLVGSGGTATALAALSLELPEYDAERIQGFELKKKELDRLQTMLGHLSTDQRNDLPGLDHGRGEIIVGGALIYNELLDLVHADQILISDGGLLEGIVLSLLPGTQLMNR